MSGGQNAILDYGTLVVAGAVWLLQAQGLVVTRVGAASVGAPSMLETFTGEIDVETEEGLPISTDFMNTNWPGWTMIAIGGWFNLCFMVMALLCFSLEERGPAAILSSQTGLVMRSTRRTLRMAFTRFETTSRWEWRMPWAASSTLVGMSPEV